MPIQQQPIGTRLYYNKDKGIWRIYENMDYFPNGWYKEGKLPFQEPVGDFKGVVFEETMTVKELKEKGYLLPKN